MSGRLLDDSSPIPGRDTESTLLHPEGLADLTSWRVSVCTLGTRNSVSQWSESIEHYIYTWTWATL